STCLDICSPRFADALPLTCAVEKPFRAALSRDRPERLWVVIYDHDSDKSPCRINSSRKATRSGSFMASTTTVVLPTAVLPATSAPTHRKCRSHLCRRGLKSLVSFLVFGSIPARFGPLWRLHRRQA